MKRTKDGERRSDKFFDPRFTTLVNGMVGMARNGYTNEDIAEEMESTTNSVATTLARVRREFGIEIPKGSPVGPPGHGGWTNSQLWKMKKRGLDIHQISDLTGLSPNLVSVRLCKWARKLGIPPRPQSRRKEAPKWHERQIAGESFSAIGASEGLSKNVVQGAVYRYRESIGFRKVLKK